MAQKTQKKVVGVVYELGFRGTWDQVAAATRATKEAIVDSRELTLRRGLGQFSHGPFVALEDRILKSVLVPDDAESFRDYAKRSFDILGAVGWRRKLGLFLIENTPVGVSPRTLKYYARNDDGDVLLVSAKFDQKNYDAKIEVAGLMEDRGERMATLLRNRIADSGIGPNYVRAPRIISY